MSEEKQADEIFTPGIGDPTRGWGATRVEDLVPHERTEPVTFSASAKECNTALDWYSRHCVEKHKIEFPYAGACGGALSWVFTSTSIGQCVGVVCGFCQEKFDATDYDEW